MVELRCYTIMLLFCNLVATCIGDGIVGYLWCTQQAGAEGEIKGHALVAAALAKDFIGGISGDDGIDDVQALEGVGGISAGVAKDEG